MGKSITPTFRIEFYTVGCHFTPAGWSKHHGRPSVYSLKAYLEAMNKAMEPGGCNEHIRKDYPMAKVTGGRLIRQSDNTVKAEVINV